MGIYMKYCHFGVSILQAGIQDGAECGNYHFPTPFVYYHIYESTWILRDIEQRKKSHENKIPFNFSSSIFAFRPRFGYFFSLKIKEIIKINVGIVRKLMGSSRDINKLSQVSCNL